MVRLRASLESRLVQRGKKKSDQTVPERLSVPFQDDLTDVLRDITRNYIAGVRKDKNTAIFWGWHENKKGVTQPDDALFILCKYLSHPPPKKQQQQQKHALSTQPRNKNKIATEKGNESNEPRNSS